MLTMTNDGNLFEALLTKAMVFQPHWKGDNTRRKINGVDNEKQEGNTPLQFALSKKYSRSANAIFEKIKDCDSTVETAFTKLNTLLKDSVSTKDQPNYP